MSRDDILSAAMSFDAPEPKRPQGAFYPDFTGERVEGDSTSVPAEELSAALAWWEWAFLQAKADRASDLRWRVAHEGMAVDMRTCRRICAEIRARIILEDTNAT